MVSQLNDQEYAIQTSDPDHSGIQLLQIEVTSEDYPDEIEPLIIEVAIDLFDCEPTDLVEPEGSKPFSALHLIFFLPLNLDISLPLYFPEPSCDLTNDDIEYVLMNELPNWIIFD